MSGPLNFARLSPVHFERSLSSSMTILREQERRQFCRFKLVFLILDAPFEGPPSEEPSPFVEKGAQKVLG